jgi:hypothetical protein
MVRIEVMILLVTIVIMMLLIMWEIFGPIQVQPQGATVHFHMQFTAVYDTVVYGDAFPIPLNKGYLDIWTYYDFMKTINKACLGMASPGCH